MGDRMISIEIIGNQALLGRDLHDFLHPNSDVVQIIQFQVAHCRSQYLEFFIRTSTHFNWEMKIYQEMSQALQTSGVFSESA